MLLKEGGHRTTGLTCFVGQLPPTQVGVALSGDCSQGERKRNPADRDVAGSISTSASGKVRSQLRRFCRAPRHQCGPPAPQYTVGPKQLRPVLRSSADETGDAKRCSNEAAHRTQPRPEVHLSKLDDEAVIAGHQFSESGRQVASRQGYVS